MPFIAVIAFVKKVTFLKKLRKHLPELKPRMHLTRWHFCQQLLASNNVQFLATLCSATENWKTIKAHITAAKVKIPTKSSDQEPVRVITATQVNNQID